MFDIETNSTSVSSSLLIRSEVPNHPLTTAFVLKDKSVFVESEFNEIFNFFKSLSSHFHFLEGVRSYLIPAIAEPGQYYEVKMMMPDFCVYSLVLSKHERSFVSCYDNKKPLKEILAIIDNEIGHPSPNAVKRVKYNRYRSPGRNTSVEGRIKKIQSDEDFLKILPQCVVKQSYENARITWYNNVIIGQGRMEEKVTSRTKLMQKISETNNEDIRLAALFTLVL